MHPQTRFDKKNRDGILLSIPQYKYMIFITMTSKQGLTKKLNRDGIFLSVPLYKYMLYISMTRL